jgi:hypothetical protein
MVTIRNNSLELEDGDTISVDGTELTFRSSGELEFPDGETAITLSDIDGANIAPNSVDANSYNESVIDHDQTTNRTHNGDDISPNGVDANAVDAGSVTADTLEADSAIVNGTADVVELLTDTLAGADLANASENQILVAQGDGTLSTQTQTQVTTQIASGSIDTTSSADAFAWGVTTDGVVITEAGSDRTTILQGMSNEVFVTLEHDGDRTVFYTIYKL